MSRRGRYDVIASALVALTAAALPSCDADPGNAGCQILWQVTLPGTPLTLLPDAHLDQVGTGFFLLGSDGTDVRWGAVASDGTLTGEQAFAPPLDAGRAYYAMAGAETPGDTVLIAHLETDPASGDGLLVVDPVPADGSPPTTAEIVAERFSGGPPPSDSLKMSSSRDGMNAGVAWIDVVAGKVMFTSLTAAGIATGAPVLVSTAVPVRSSLAFSPGKDALTVTYYSDALATSDSGAGWVIGEASETGSVDSVTMLSSSKAAPPPPLVVTPTADGYGLVWQNTEGSWLGVYSASTRTFSGAFPFGAASSFGGVDAQPSLVGLSSFGTDFGVLLSRPMDIELWRLDRMGNRRPGAVIFPSINGDFSLPSALPVVLSSTSGPSLIVTYADYTGPADASLQTGGRVVLDAVCY